jgi:hypothetical protein
MAAQYKIEKDGSISIIMNICPHGSMLEQEEQIAAAVAEVGRLATELSLKGFDTDGQPIVVDNMKTYQPRGGKKTFQTPWGEVLVS